MKSKFEKELREKAYSAVPDGWDEVEKKAKVFEPSGIINKAKSSPVKTIAAAAAAVAVVIGAGEPDRAAFAAASLFILIPLIVYNIFDEEILDGLKNFRLKYCNRNL